MKSLTLIIYKNNYLNISVIIINYRVIINFII